MRVLVDTNVLVRIVAQHDPRHLLVRNAVRILFTEGESLHIVPQVLYEFWAVATRPFTKNGLGLSVEAVDEAVDKFRANFKLSVDPPGIFATWRAICKAHRVIGKQSHDARLGAAMSEHGLTHILTFNVADFVRYKGIATPAPENVVG